MNPSALTQLHWFMLDRCELWHLQLCICVGRNVYVCAHVHTLDKSVFLGNIDFNFKLFPGMLFKGRQLISNVRKSLARFVMNIALFSCLNLLPMKLFSFIETALLRLSHHDLHHATALTLFPHLSSFLCVFQKTYKIWTLYKAVLPLSLDWNSI